MAIRINGNVVIDDSQNSTLTGFQSVTGNVTGGNVISTGIVTATGNLTVNFASLATAIVNGGTNGVGNIGAAGASFNTVFARATTAQYADVAERYTADAVYAPGTVLMFGGVAEVTVAADSTARVAGVVTTNPALLMNDQLMGVTADVALLGRVPVRVVGSVNKGDMLVSAGQGRARAAADPKVGTVIGKSLETVAAAVDEESTVEVVVGRV